MRFVHVRIPAPSGGIIDGLCTALLRNTDVGFKIVVEMGSVWRVRERVSLFFYFWFQSPGSYLQLSLHSVGSLGTGIVLEHQVHL